jgi:hypothetical protein
MADPESSRPWYERLDDSAANIYAGGYPGSAYAEALGAGAKALGSAANAVINGAYSSLDNTYDAVRGVARGVGLLGPEEFRRFGQEADFAGASLGQVGSALRQIAEHPNPAFQAALRSVEEEPLLPFYTAGRFGMGAITGLGPAAVAGGILRGLENGHNLVDAILYPGVQGRPPPGGLLGIPPEGRGLLSIPPQDPR